MLRLSLFLLVAMVAAACAGPSTAPSPAKENQPKYGGTFSVTADSDPFDFDMSHGGKTTTNSDSIALAYESLLAFKGGPDVKHTDSTIVPELAETWEVSPDARTFTFHLRKGVKYANMAP